MKNRRGKEKAMNQKKKWKRMIEKKKKKNGWLVGWLVFYGISTFVDY